MVDSMHPLHNVVQAPSAPEVSKPQPQQRPGGATPFQEILDSQLQRSEDLKFSMHAQQRLQARNITLGVHDVERLKQGVNQIADKGGRESLVLMDNSAFLVSVTNRTVITAIDGNQMKNNVFTNIDSTIIV